VKSISAILLLSITMLAQTELHQVLKLNVFAHHFEEHQKENPKISVLSFIILHYFSGNLKDKDFDKDMQLPFKTVDCSTAFSVAVTPNYGLTITEPVFFVTRSYPALKDNFVLSCHTTDIWQPPKFS
jgi:hypothetical protein